MNQKPVAILKALGTYRKDRHAQRLENKLDMLSPDTLIEIPDILTDTQVREQYKELAEQLKHWNILAMMDLIELEQAFSLLQEIKRIQAILKDTPVVSPDYNKLATLKNNALKVFNTLMKNYGVSPKARMRLVLDTVEAKKNTTILDKIKEKAQ